MQPEIYIKRAERKLIEEGFSDFSMEHVALMIGVTKRTLYNNFESRDDFFRCLTDMQRERIRTDTLPLFSLYGIDAAGILREWYLYNKHFLDNLRSVYIPTLQNHIPAWYNLFLEMMKRNCREFAALLVPRGRDEGLFTRNFDSDSYALFIYRILLTSSETSAETDIIFLTRCIRVESNSYMSPL